LALEAPAIAGRGDSSYDTFCDAGGGKIMPEPKRNGQNGRDGRNGASHAHEANPEHIVSVQDFSPETLRSVIAHLEASTEFEHLVYREAELDAIWTITGFFLVNEPRSSERDTVRRLHAGVHRAHDLVAASQPDAAAAVLRGFL